MFLFLSGACIQVLYVPLVFLTLCEVSCAIFGHMLLITLVCKTTDKVYAMGFLSEALQKGVALRADAWGSTINACKATHQWEKALALYAAATKEHHVKPNVILCSSTMSACEKGSGWTHALHLLEDMRMAAMGLDVIIFSTAISACQKGHSWEQALGYLSEMRHQRVQANAITYGAVISACGGGQQWARTREETSMIEN